MGLVGEECQGGHQVEGAEVGAQRLLAAAGGGDHIEDVRQLHLGGAKADVGEAVQAVAHAHRKGFARIGGADRGVQHLVEGQRGVQQTVHLTGGKVYLRGRRQIAVEFQQVQPGIGQAVVGSRVEGQRGAEHLAQQRIEHGRLLGVQGSQPTAEGEGRQRRALRHGHGLEIHPLAPEPAQHQAGGHLLVGQYPHRFGAHRGRREHPPFLRAVQRHITEADAVLAGRKAGAVAMPRRRHVGHRHHLGSVGGAAEPGAGRALHGRHVGHPLQLALLVVETSGIHRQRQHHQGHQQHHGRHQADGATLSSQAVHVGTHSLDDDPPSTDMLLP
ncbi:hypothetical protein D9M70_435580 [compost metagenome]